MRRILTRAEAGRERGAGGRQARFRPKPEAKRRDVAGARAGPRRRTARIVWLRWFREAGIEPPEVGRARMDPGVVKLPQCMTKRVLRAASGQAKQSPWGALAGGAPDARNP